MQFFLLGPSISSSSFFSTFSSLQGCLRLCDLSRSLISLPLSVLPSWAFDKATWIKRESETLRSAAQSLLTHLDTCIRKRVQPRASVRALTGSTLSLQPAKRNHAQQLVCLRVFASVWHSLKSANRSSHRTSSRPCQPQSPDKPSGCPIWHGVTHTCRHTRTSWPERFRLDWRVWALRVLWVHALAGPSQLFNKINTGLLPWRCQL